MKLKYFLVVFAILASCTAFKRENMHADKTPQSDTCRILYYASLAGSSHNTQPWKVIAYGNDSLLIYPDFSRKLTVVDHEGRELYMSVGAFIENLETAACCLGYETETKYGNFSGDSPEPLASVTLIKSGPLKNSEELKKIELRRTLRIPFDTLSLTENDRKRLTSIDNNIHFIPGDSEQGDYMQQNALEAYTLQSGDNDAQDELAFWIRFSNKEVKTKRDGLSSAGMDIKGVSGFFVRTFFKAGDSKKAMFVEKGIEKTRQQVDKCGGWIVITQDSSCIMSWLNTGRLYERINLECRSLGLGFHPMNQIVEEPEFAGPVNRYLGYNGKIMFIARIGYVQNYPEPVSVRRAVEEFTEFR